MFKSIYVFRLCISKTRPLQNALKSLAFSSQIHERQGIVTPVLLYEFAELYHCEQNKLKALEYYQKALELCRQQKKQSLESHILYRLGKLLFEQDNLVQAMEYFSQSKTVKEEIQDILGLTTLIYGDSTHIHAPQPTRECHWKLS